MSRLRQRLSTLRVKVPTTAMAVFAISLAVAAILAYELFIQDGRRDTEVVLARETQRFELSIASLLDDIRTDTPDLPASEALRSAVTRYLQLNPSTESYWTIVHFEDGPPLAAYNGPPELEPLFEAGELPLGPLNEGRTLETRAGDVRTWTTPVVLDGEHLATLQVVTPMEPVHAEAREAAWLVVAAAAVSLVLGGILLTASLARSLAPLGDLAAAARSTELRSLHARVDEPDTTDEVADLAREFNTMLDRLDRASAAQQQFMASIGHELRTPITIARGHVELLGTVDQDDPSALRETAAILQDELSRMGRLVDDLMAIARADMDGFVRPRQLELVGWFEDLELKVAGLGDAAADVRIVPPPPVMVYADPDRLAQAVLNLITNACTHTPPGTRVEVSADHLDDHVTLAVSDDGPGIDPDIRDEVFAPFVRAGDVPTSTGLGLAVVKAVVEAHGGEVALRAGGSGTRVELRLPDPPADERNVVAGLAASVQPTGRTDPAEDTVDADGDDASTVDSTTRTSEGEAGAAGTETARLPRADDDGARPTLPMRRL